MLNCGRIYRPSSSRRKRNAGTHINHPVHLNRPESLLSQAGHPHLQRKSTVRKRTTTVLQVPQTIVQVRPVPSRQLLSILTGRFLGSRAPLVYYSGELQRETDWPPLPSRKPERSVETFATPRSRSRSPPRTITPPPIYDDEHSTLADLQRKFDEEDSRLRAEREALTTVQPSIFTCAVCTEEYPEDFVARVPDCDHGFCRECLKTYAVSKLEEHRFPILCPSCVADNTGKPPGGEWHFPLADAELKTDPLEAITGSLITDVGISQHYFQIFEELQMSCFSILIHCRGYDAVDL